MIAIILPVGKRMVAQVARATDTLSPALHSQLPYPWWCRPFVVSLPLSPSPSLPTLVLSNTMFIVEVLLLLSLLR